MSKNVNEGYRLAHTMIRVKDLETSFNFYCKTLIDPYEFFKLGLEKQRRLLEKTDKTLKTTFIH